MRAAETGSAASPAEAGDVSTEVVGAVRDVLPSNKIENRSVNKLKQDLKCNQKICVCVQLLLEAKRSLLITLLIS